MSMYLDPGSGFFVIIQLTIARCCLMNVCICVWISDKNFGRSNHFGKDFKSITLHLLTTNIILN